jgi:uncharacterized YigZ family protein
METDSYFTIESQSEGLYKVKGSRFLAFAYPAISEDEIRKILESLRKEYHDARHHCYAWRLGTVPDHFRTNDDGEPSNSAGKPILGQIQSFKVTNVLIIVVRYFGGILLGVSGLVKAYKSASMEALNNAKIIKCYVYEYYSLNFRYEDMNLVMKVLKDMDLEQWDQRFEIECELKLKVRKSEEKNLLDSFRPDTSVRLKVLKKE